MNLHPRLSQWLRLRFCESSLLRSSPASQPNILLLLKETGLLEIPHSSLPSPSQTKTLLVHQVNPTHMLWQLKASLPQASLIQANLNLVNLN